MEDNITVHAEAESMLSSGPYANPWDGVETINAAKWTVAAVSLDITDADNDRD